MLLAMTVLAYYMSEHDNASGIYCLSSCLFDWNIKSCNWKNSEQKPILLSYLKDCLW